MAIPKRNLLLFATTGLLSASYGVMFTVLADFRDRYGISEAAVGWIVAMGFFTSFAAQVLLAPLADRGFARRLVLFGTTVGIVGTIGMAVGNTFAELLAARFLMGIGFGLAIPAIRRILIVGDPDRLGDNLGTLLSVDVAGFAFGPVISALTADRFGLAAPFLLVAGAIGALLPMLARINVVEGSHTNQTERFAVDLLRVPAVASAVLLGVAAFVMIGTFDALWSLVMRDMDAPTWIAKAGITVFALPLIFIGPIGGRLAARVGPYRCGAAGMLAAAVFMVGYGTLPTPLSMLAVGLVHAICDGLTISSAGIAIGGAAPAERQAAAQGLLGGSQTLMGGLAALVGGGLYGATSRATAYVCAAAAMVTLVGLAVALARRAGQFSAPAAGAAPVATPQERELRTSVGAG